MDIGYGLATKQSLDHGEFLNRGCFVYSVIRGRTVAFASVGLLSGGGFFVPSLYAENMLYRGSKTSKQRLAQGHKPIGMLSTV